MNNFLLWKTSIAICAGCENEFSLTVAKPAKKNLKIRQGNNIHQKNIFPPRGVYRNQVGFEAGGTILEARRQHPPTPAPPEYRNIFFPYFCFIFFPSSFLILLRTCWKPTPPPLPSWIRLCARYGERIFLF